MRTRNITAKQLPSVAKATANSCSGHFPRFETLILSVLCSARIQVGQENYRNISEQGLTEYLWIKKCGERSSPPCIFLLYLFSALAVGPCKGPLYTDRLGITLTTQNRGCCSRATLLSRKREEFTIVRQVERRILSYDSYLVPGENRNPLWSQPSPFSEGKGRERVSFCDISRCVVLTLSIF